MPESLVSVFGDPADFAAGLRPDGVLRLLVTGQGRFRARLTRITLRHLRLVSAEEELPRIAFLAAPADTVSVFFALGRRAAPTWGGMAVGPREILTFGPGERLHARTAGPCHWGTVLLRHGDLVAYIRALSGAEPAIPAVARWRPGRAALRRLRHFHSAAIRIAEMRSAFLAGIEAAHGLEQQLVHALTDCLCAGSMKTETTRKAGRRETLARFDDLLRHRPALRVAEACRVLGVSPSELRQGCEEQLGIPPSRYIRLARGLHYNDGP
jgi:AraC-like DNA-binding protein